MGFMNGFVEKEFVNMRRFLDDISVSYIKKKSFAKKNAFEILQTQ